VDDRNIWRNAIETRNYDSQCSYLQWGKEKEKEKQFTDKSLPVLVAEGGENGSSPSSDSNKEGDTNGGPGLNPVIKDLACAILQVRQMVEPKFFKKPLGGKFILYSFPGGLD